LSTVTEHVLKSGKKVTVYDNFIPLILRSTLFQFVKESRFVIGWHDGEYVKARSHEFLHSQYSLEDNENAGLLPFLRTTEINKHIEGADPLKSMINLSVPCDTHFPHAHPESLVVLYYVNLEWENHWHGETLFYTEDLNDIELALKYTPGRVIVFDGSIPHAIRPQSISADKHRFTYAMTFEKEAK
jgi:hypothetical protein